MFNTALAFLLSILTQSTAQTADPYTESAKGLAEPVAVFQAGENGYPHFRIPSLGRSNDGTILAFAEGRYEADDHARNDIVLKRSMDGGKTWGELQVIHHDKNLVMVNPSAVTLSSGRILLMYETFPHGFHSRNGTAAGVTYRMMDDGFGERTQQLLLRQSDDGGATWTKPTQLQRISRKDKQMIQSGSPSNGIQLTRGKHKGRILFPMFLTRRLDDKNRTWRDAVLYSDDQGANWKLSNYVPVEKTENCNECLIAETDEGDVVMNARAMRNQHRAISRSTDGGVTWSPFENSAELIHRPCNAGRLKFSYGDEGKSLSLFSYNNSTTRRANGYLAMSTDDGKSWPKQMQIVPGLFGYSQLVKIDKSTVGVLYEPFESPKEKWSIYFLATTPNID